MERIGEYRKLSDRAQEKLDMTLQALKSEFGNEIDIIDTADSVVITFQKGTKDERAFNFTKIGDKLPDGNSWYPIEDVISAKVHYPDEEIRESIKKISDK